MRSPDDDAIHEGHPASGPTPLPENETPRNAFREGLPPPPASASPVRRALKAGLFVGISVAVTSIVFLCYRYLDLRELGRPTGPHGGGRVWEVFGFLLICLFSLGLAVLVALPTALVAGIALRLTQRPTERQLQTVGSGNLPRFLKIGLLPVPAALTLLCWILVHWAANPRINSRTTLPIHIDPPPINPPHQDPAANPQLSQPPRLLTPSEIDREQFLIDAEGLRGWSVGGLSTLENNNLVFGGNQPTGAFLLKKLPTAFRLQFDFCQEGAGKAELHLQPDSHPAFGSGKTSLVDLNLNQKYKRWHRCTLVATYEQNAYHLSINVEPIVKGYGKTIGKSIAIGGDKSSRQDGESPRHFVGFELAEGSKLHLRNVIVAEQKTGPIDLVANNQVGSLVARGDDLLRTGKFAQAIEEFTRALVVDPENVVCLERRAEAYGRMGLAQKDEKWFVMGINDCSAIIEKHPKASSAYCWRGLIRAWKGEHDRAIDDSNHALELDPQDAKAYNIRGWAYFNKNDLNKAIADYDRAIDLDPKRAQAYIDRSIAHEKRGDLAKAKEDRTKASQLDSKRFPY